MVGVAIDGDIVHCLFRIDGGINWQNTGQGKGVSDG